MQWLKRGRANDSLTGHGAIMGSKTKKVLDYSDPAQTNYVVSVKVHGQKVKILLIMTAVKITKVHQNQWNLKWELDYSMMLLIMG